MLMWLAIAVLILAGIALIIVELIFIPGTTVVGILGLALVISGIIFSYSEFGPATGNYVLIGTSVNSLAILYLSFRKGVWKKFSLKTSIDSKVNEGIAAEFKVGDMGVAVSALRPMGTAEIGGKMIEVKTNGDYLAPGTPIRVIRIQANDILVEQTT